MRPNESQGGVAVAADVYECFDCGRRDEDVDRRVCRSCGGELYHIGRARDL